MANLSALKVEKMFINELKPQKSELIELLHLNRVEKKNVLPF